VRELLNAVPRATPEPTLDDARAVLAHQFGFATWAELAESMAQPQESDAISAPGLTTAPPFYRIDEKHNTIEPQPPLADRDWDAIFAVMEQRGITGIATSAMIDSALERVSRLSFVTRVHIGGAKRVTDAGLMALAAMPQLEELELGGWHCPTTDRGLEVLRHLTALRQFNMGWAQQISDAGVAHLTFCDRLESVNLMGTPTGDGALNALRGKPGLHRLSTGKLVTDRGIPLLQDFPAFRKWAARDIPLGLMTFTPDAHSLLLDGPFTDEGLARLRGLDGLFGLNFFWHSKAFTSGGLAVLQDLPNLGMVGCDGNMCDNAAMRAFAAVPRLRLLMIQGAVASDEGWTALSKSPSIEYIWGRECPNLRGRGFAALAALPSLKGLGVSCLNVDDASLATLPGFPALRQLMPMDVPDEGFRHVGRCQRLEDLWCMYCRDTGDLATGHLAGLPNLRSYYAGKTLITDQSLAVLGGMRSLEKLEFWEIAGITDAGIAELSRLPRLREISVEGSPNVTRDCFRVFPPTVYTRHS
jgi:F-box/leucine-rich repeat protein 14